MLEGVWDSLHVVWDLFLELPSPIFSCFVDLGLASQSLRPSFTPVHHRLWPTAFHCHFSIPAGRLGGSRSSGSSHGDRFVTSDFNFLVLLSLGLEIMDSPRLLSIFPSFFRWCPPRAPPRGLPFASLSLSDPSVL